MEEKSRHVFCQFADRLLRLLGMPRPSPKGKQAMNQARRAAMAGKEERKHTEYYLPSF